MKISQNPAELEDLLALLVRKKVTSLLEVGSRYGTTLMDMARAMPKGSTVVSIELAGGPWGRPDSLPKLIDVMQELSDEGYNTQLLLGNSAAAHIITQATALGPYDFVFIDGDHSLKGVTHDWENFRGIAKHVGFHDINTALDVTPFWEALKCVHPDREYAEFIAPHPPEMGIGVIQGDIL